MIPGAGLAILNYSITSDRGDVNNYPVISYHMQTNHVYSKQPATI